VYACVQLVIKRDPASANTHLHMPHLHLSIVHGDVVVGSSKEYHRQRFWVLLQQRLQAPQYAFCGLAINACINELQLLVAGC